MTWHSVLLVLAASSAPALHAATFTVNTTADLADTNPGDGFCATTAFTCSLRAAIQESNTTPAADTIAFAIPGAGPHTFATATLPVVSNPLVIDGFTQPGSLPNSTPSGSLNAVLKIELAGGLVLRGGTVTVRGVVSNGGVLDFGAGPSPASNVLEGCYVGTDASGTVDRSTGDGVSFTLTNGPVRVGGAAPAQRNLVSGNVVGVRLRCAPGGGPCNPGSVIQGNLIGTDVSGVAALGNATGISTDTSGTLTIGGPFAGAETNVISGNTAAGIAIAGNTSSGVVVVQGNRIGRDATGTRLVPNGVGITIDPSCFGPGCNSGSGPPVTIGGSQAAGNVVQNNLSHGIAATTGMLDIAHNVIEGNGGSGIFLETPTPWGISGQITSNGIRGNSGHGIAGNGILGRAFVTIGQNNIGGTNGGDGVSLRGGFRAHVVANAMAGNGGLGIDLGDDGVTPNDFLDQDSGPNDLMNFPVLSSACWNGTSGIVTGTIHTRPNFASMIEISRTSACDTSGHGEGLYPQATTIAITDSAGNAAFSAPLSATVFPADFVVATATSGAGATSEYGACLPVVTVSPPPQAISGPSAVCTGSPFTLAAVPGADAYQWLLDGTPIAGATRSAYGKAVSAPADAGSYSVRATTCGMEVTSPTHALAVVACGGFPLGLDVDRHPLAGTASDLNGVLEPFEAAAIEPRYRNDSGAALTLSGTATIGGPAGGTYALPDPTADYGSVPAGQVTDCFGATGNCYVAAVSAAARPAAHWDATFTETTSAGDPSRAFRLHVGESFTDVPRSHLFYRFVETLIHNGVTGGCTASTYCPLSGTTREQMAVFALAAKEGPLYRPPACSQSAPRFQDVGANGPFCPWIEELARRGVVAGCAANLYCPTAGVARDQMTVFMLRTLDPTLTPPACVVGAERFADVPASSPFCRWVEELARRNVVTGCGNGNFCPSLTVSRGEMSVFLTGTFALLLYGP